MVTEGIPEVQLSIAMRIAPLRATEFGIYDGRGGIFLLAHLGMMFDMLTSLHGLVSEDVARMTRTRHKKGSSMRGTSHRRKQ
jgi:hypothetical protein